MISSQYIKTMARYNCWQNQSIFGASDPLGDEARKQNRGAFFDSIHRTLSHLLWGDSLWMSRFGEFEPPEMSSIADSKGMIKDWSELKRRRTIADKHMLVWANGVNDTDLSGNLSWYSGAVGREVTQSFSTIMVHFFNHQTHHRGQVHAMVTAAGGKPDDTDVVFMPDVVEVRDL